MSGAVVRQFRNDSGRLTPIDMGGRLDPGAVWIDLLQPEEDVLREVEATYGLPLPHLADLSEIEATSRVIETPGVLQLRSFFFRDGVDEPNHMTVASLVTPERIVTIRAHDAPAFLILRHRIDAGSVMSDPWNVYIALHEIELDQIADQLERLQSDLASHGTELIERDPRSADFERSSAELIRIQNVSGLVRLSLIDIERLLSYLRREAEVSSEHAHRIREMLRDIESLAAHTSFVLEKVSFLSSIIMGRIGLQENHIIRVLSIAAGVFLPPTLIASIYGMNFRVMPELRWPFGYPLAGVLMLLSALLPLWYFKRQHWL